MEQYGLYTNIKPDAKSNSNEELIHSLKAESLEEAIILFSKRKKLSKRVLLEIFDVKKID